VARAWRWPVTSI